MAWGDADYSVSPRPSMAGGQITSKAIGTKMSSASGEAKPAITEVSARANPKNTSTLEAQVSARRRLALGLLALQQSWLLLRINDLNPLEDSLSAVRSVGVPPDFDSHPHVKTVRLPDLDRTASDIGQESLVL